MFQNRIFLSKYLTFSAFALILFCGSILCVDLYAQGDGEAVSADTAAEVPSGDAVSAGETALDGEASGEETASAEETPSVPETPAPLSDRERAEAAVEGENLVRDVHLETVETLQLSEEAAKEAVRVSESYLKTLQETVRLRTELDFLEKENAYLRQAAGERGEFSRFLTQLGALEDAELQEYIPTAVMVLRDGAVPAAETLEGIRTKIEKKSEMQQYTLEKLHQTLVEREFLQFDLQSNRHIVTQIASMFSMDKRWFWLLGVVAFGALIAAVWHERRHEIRRWLNGGRARQMRLAQVLTACFALLVSMTLISFFMGEFIYRAMLDMTFHSTAPSAVYAHLEGELTKEAKGLEAKLELEQKEQERIHEVWKEAAEKQVADADSFMNAWSSWRNSVREIVVQGKLLAETDRQIREDEKKLREISAAMGTVSGDTLFYLRIKHLVRFLLGGFLGLGTFLGIACFWSELRVRVQRMQNTCPHCLSVNTLQPCDEHGNQLPEEYQKSPMVICTKMVQETPYEMCGYRFARSLRPLTKLSFPTLGIPQVGKTHWLTMLYWEIRNQYYPKLGFSCIQSSVTEEMDRRVEEIMNYRMGTAATQRDSIPLPLVLKYRDRDPLGRSEILADIFDYSGEITTDAASDDYRRERALKSEGFLFFLDPTFPWQPQAEALRRFRKDLKSIKGLRGKESLHLPIAVCLTKIDLLPLVKSLGADAEGEAIRFYEALGSVDPTGLALNKKVIEARSALTDELRKKIWPDWDMEAQINDLFGGRFRFFPLTPVGLDGVGEADLSQRTIAPFGLVEPLAWLLEMSGYPTLDSK